MDFLKKTKKSEKTFENLLTNAFFGGIIAEHLRVWHGAFWVLGAGRKKFEKNEKNFEKPLDKRKETWYTNKAAAAEGRRTGIDPWKLNNRISNETCKKFVVEQTGVCRRNLVKKHIE